MNTHGIITEQERESIRARSSSTHKKQGNNYLTVNNERVEIIKYDLTPARTETGKAQHSDLVGSPHGNPDTTRRQAAHSPLPWSVQKAFLSDTSAIVTDKGIVTIGLKHPDAKLIVASVNHADKLTERMRILIGCAERGLDQSATHDGLSNADAIAKARAELAAYEAAQ